MKNALKNPVILSISGGLIMSLAWWEHFTGLIMFVAFIPFIHSLYLAKSRHITSSRIFTQIIPGFLVFNILTFSWLGNVSVAGAAMAILAHSFLMSFALWIVYKIFLKASLLTSALSFISIWMAYEYACLNIYIISPWLNAGNVFGKEPSLIQWYEFTGSGGGTLWILLTNLLIYYLIIRSAGLRRLMTKYIFIVITIIVLPISISIIIGKNISENNRTEEVVIVQPNIDPFTEKFESQSFIFQLDEMLSLAEKIVDENTKWLILPETAIDDPFYEALADTNRYIKRLRAFSEDYDSLNIILGATTMVTSGMQDFHNKSYSQNENSTSGDQLFNSAIHIGPKQKISFYHKSKLVPGIERKVSLLPRFLEKIIIPELGGSMSGYGVQDEREIFEHSLTGSRIAPVICYESAFGEFVTEYVDKGAEIITIITNDGWWNKTAGYKQHLWFASLRAIETRRPVVRSANTGISCIVDNRGRILESLPWWEKGVIHSEVHPGNKTTVYSTHGDLLYRYFTFAGLIIIILAFVAAPLRNSRKMQPLK